MTKERLRQYRKLVDDINKKENRLLELETRATNITYCMEQDPVSGGGSKDKMADQVAAIVELKDEINEQLAFLYREERELKTTREMLEKYCWINKEIKELEELLFEAETKATSLESWIKPEIITGGSVIDPVSCDVAIIVELKNKINDKIKEANEAKIKIREIIQPLNLKERNIFTLRYLECNKWDEVSIKVNDSLRNVHRTHGMAIEKLTK